MKTTIALTLIFILTAGLCAAKESQANKNKIKSIFDYDSQLFLFTPYGYNPFNYRPFNPSQYSFIEEPGKTEQIGGIYFDESAQKYLILSKNFLDMNTNLFVAGDINVQNIKDLKGLEIGVVKGDFVINFFKTHYPYLKLKIVNSHEELVFKAVRGEIGAFAQNFPTAMLLLGKYRAINYFKQFKLFFQENKSISASPFDLQELIKNEGQKNKNTPKKQAKESEEKEKQNEKIKELAPQEQEVPTPSMTTMKKTSWLTANLILIWVIGLLTGIFLFLLIWKRKKKKTETDWKDILRGGENEFAEFKSSLKWDYKMQQINPILEYVTAKSISAFLNAKGGWLFIGISDEGEILGLESDYNILNKKNKDGFILKLGEIVNGYLGKELHQYLKIFIYTLQDKEIAVIRIYPSKKPVFLKNKNKEEFFIRAGASTQSMGLKEAHEYITSHWG